MVELLEYIIIFSISAGLAGASVALVDGAFPGLTQVAAASQADQIAGGARLAIVQDDNVTLLLPLQNASISCASGSLSVSTGGDDLHSYPVGFPCYFDDQALEGSCELVFSTTNDYLSLQANC
jgi:hypothetical protein